MSRNGRIALLAAALAVAVAATVVIGTGGDDEENGSPTTATPSARTGTATSATAPARPASPAVPLVTLRDGRPVDGARDLEFESGERARFAIASDTAQEIHVHGYDITRRVPAGGRATISFRATIEGAFEVESHETGEPIATLKVSP